MNKTYDVLIIGAGINGCSIAYQTASRNRRTVVLEKNTVGAEASSAAAGMLGAQSEMEEYSPFFEFARRSRSMFPELVPELEEKSGTAVSYVRNGMIKVADTPEEQERLARMYAFQKRAGEEVEWLQPDMVKTIDRSIGGDYFGAIYLQGDGQVKAPELTKAYAGAAVREGAEFYEYTPALGFIFENGRVTGVETPQGRFYADQIVLAGGAWSRFMPPLGEELPPLIPVKGECVGLHSKRPIVEKTVHASDFYIVPKPGGSIIIGATEREGEMGKEVSAEAVQHLLHKACRLVPGLGRASWQYAWSGVRPQSADGKPYLGQTAFDGLWMAAGHYRNGILLSAVTGTWMADLLEGKAQEQEWIDAFSPQRLIHRKEEEIIGTDY
ncbi:glycine oxidase ThiO [Salibacterium halotolerans]|uniref:glycine oxidase n=1 Tax=Salibacterium halotolerans TaxID=1884432 RepID=A0A1I5TUK8_9BACI|nr:glycine oxidase ThiO [Salibacterium halotolerans]SFP86765.1 glycine oxidase [Salibacterium halotolerans]